MPRVCRCTGSEPWLSARAGGGPGGGGCTAARERADAQRAPGPRVPAPPPPARPGRPRLARVVRRRGRLAGRHERRRDGRAQVLPGGAPCPNPVLEEAVQCVDRSARRSSCTTRLLGRGCRGSHRPPVHASHAFASSSRGGNTAPHVLMLVLLQAWTLTMPASHCLPCQLRVRWAAAPSAGPSHSGADHCLHHWPTI